MARRNKRASMREGPLADLFRSTTRDEGEVAGDEGETAQHATPEPATQDFGSAGQDYETDVLSEEGYEEPRAEPGGAIFDIEEEEPAPTQLAEPPATRLSEPPAHDPAALDPPVREDVNVYRAEAETHIVPAPEETRREPRERLRHIFSEGPDEPEGPRFGRDEGAQRPRVAPTVHTPVIRVVGVGGAGVNAVNRMVEAHIPGVEFLAVNTDLQSLQQTMADVTVHIGAGLTRGLGSGSDPKVGFQAAFEEQDRIKRLLKGADLVFVTAGTGGGTGTGAAPVLARLARENGALTVGIVTRPFSFEGSLRQKQSDQGVQALADEVDTLIVIPNERLLSVLARNTTMVEAFRVADDVLRQGVQGISELVTLPGLINLDFADVRTTMRDAGQALLGIGMGSGDNRAIYAAERAVSSPLLETSVDGARSILLSITGGPDLSLVEVSEAARVVQEAAHPDANIIFGANIDEDLTEQVWVTVIATRFDANGRRQDGTSRGFKRDVVRPSARKSREREPGMGTPSLEGRPRDLGIDVPEFLPGQ
jgi:cell division protein FtsZ